MKHIFVIFPLCCLQAILSAQSVNYKLEVLTQPYKELVNPIILCQDSIGLLHNFTLDQPIQVFSEEVDSFYIMNWSNLHLALGNKKSKESDLFVPINTALRKKTTAIDSVGFSISYEIVGDIGNRIIKIQWQNVIPKITVDIHDVFNVQMIVDESDQSVAYHFGPMPEYFNTTFSLFGQGRSLALYFFDDFNALLSPRNEIYSIGPSFQDMTKLALSKFILLDAEFHDESYSTYLHYDHPNATLNSGQMFKISLLKTLIAEDTSIEPIIIYPNPATDNLYLRNLNREFKEYEIMDRLGSIIKKGNIDTNSIDIAELSSGLYLIRLKSKDEVYELIRFIKL